MSRRALTLLETLVCGLLISCVVLGVVGLFVGCAQAFRHADQQEMAGRMAEQALEKARVTPFAELVIGRRPLANWTADDIEYQGVQEILAQPASTKLKRVRVTITWSYRKHAQQLVRESWINAIKS